MKALVAIPRGDTFDTFFTPDNIRLIESFGEVIWHNSKSQMTEAEVAEAIGDCDTYFALWGTPALSETVMERAKSLKLMTVLGSTVAPYVSDAMWDRGIRVISAFDFFSESTAEGAVAYMLAALRRIPYYSERLRREGIWKSPEDRSDGLIRKTVGIVGYGGVGRHLARMLSGFHLKLKVYDIRTIPAEDAARYGIEQCSMEELFSTCDVVSINLPHNDKTHRLIGDAQFSMMKEGALLVNTARGQILDQAALTSHLGRGRIRAALDVFEKEPIDPDDPLIGLDNVLLTPHQGGPTANLRPILTEAMIRESAAFINEGAPLKSEISRAYAAGMSKH